MIGALRHILTLQEKILVPDTGGGYSEDWQDVAENAAIFAAVESLGGRENLRQHKVQATASHRITMRYRSDIATDMRLVEGGTVHDIVAVIDPDHRREYLQVYTLSQI